MPFLSVGRCPPYVTIPPALHARMCVPLACAHMHRAETLTLPLVDTNVLKNNLEKNVECICHVNDGIQGWGRAGPTLNGENSSFAGALISVFSFVLSCWTTYFKCN